MSKQFLAVVLIVFFCAFSSISEKQKQTTPQKRTASQSTDRLVSPIIPIEVQLTYYKLKTPSVILTIKNNDPKRKVSSVICSIQAFDSIRLTVSKDFKTLIFSFAIPVGPRETGKAILETSEEGFYPGRCIGFQPKKGSPTVFLPDKCTQDAFTVGITTVFFSDN